MRRRTKGLLTILIIVAITIPMALYILNGILNPPPPEALNLDEAPLSSLPTNIRYIELQVENSDGILKSVVIYGTIEPQSVDPVFFALAGIMVAISVIVVVGLIWTGRIKFEGE